MYSYLLREIARQRVEDQRRAARHYDPVARARPVRPGGEPTRSTPGILVALLLAVLR